MKAIPNSLKHLLADLRQLRRELRQLRENPPPPVDLTETFRRAMRPPKGKP